MRPLSIINDAGFVKLLQFLEPGYQVPSRTNLAGVLKKRHKASQGELTCILQETRGLALTTDAWTSKAVLSFQTFSGHFISRDWKLVTFILETSHFGGSHTGRQIADKVCDAVQKVRVSDKVVCVVQDEAANAVAAGELLKKEK